MSRERARKSERGQTLVSNNGGMLACAARTNCPTVKTIRHAQYQERPVAT